VKSRHPFSRRKTSRSAACARARLTATLIPTGSSSLPPRTTRPSSSLATS
jgi:hypothetical protein